MDLNFKPMKLIKMKFYRDAMRVGIVAMLSSCMPDPIEVRNIPSPHSRITVSTQIVPDQSIVVFLTRSMGALDAGRDSDLQTLLDQIIVDDATVTIAYDERKIDTLTNLGEGLYGSSATPIRAGQFYTLTVDSPSQGAISATTKAQEPISFLTINASLYKGEYDSLAQIAYSLHDPSVKNFYMINVQRLSREQDISSLFNPRVFTYVTTDEKFNGTVFEDEFKVFFQGYNVGDTVAVSLTNISEEYYGYVKKRVDNRFDLTSFATEPFNYPTNVKGGYGYFNIQQPDVHIFTLE
jgi:hypothetical protein